MKVILAGGGTAGHINPALAIAETVMHRDKKSEILFIGTKKGMENTLVPKRGFDIRYINVQGMQRKFTAKNFVSAVKCVTAIKKSKKIIKEFKPDIVIGTGGYVCAPVVIAANMLKIPTLIHEQNVFPGNTIKMLTKKSSVTAISFVQSTKYLGDAKEIILSGNPLRSGILNADRAKARGHLNLGDKKFVVVFGGSLGARKINDVVCDYIEKYSNNADVRICIATGSHCYERVVARLGNKYKNVDIREYIYDMDRVMAAADLIVCRSGAITVSEICALGVPSVLVPSPNVTNNHQEYNARALSDEGAAITILENDFDVDSLKNAADKILNDEDVASQMKKKALSIAKYDAAEIIYNKMCKLIAERE